MNNTKCRKIGSSISSIKKGFYGACIVMVVLTFLPSDASAVALSRKSRVTPYIEVRETFDDNVFFIPEGGSLADAPLATNPQSEDDSVFNLNAGVGIQLDVTRLLTLDFSYGLNYQNYADNSDNNQFIHNLRLGATIAPRSAGENPRGFLDRLTLRIQDNLATVPIDSEEPLLPGNKTFRNTFGITPTYRIIDTRRLSLDAGYGYQRVDFTEEEVDLAGVPLVETRQVTSNSQTHSGLVTVSYIINPRLTFVSDYTISQVIREDPEFTDIVDPRTRADITRQRILGGVDFKLSPKVSGFAKVGFDHTSFSSVDVVDPVTGLVQQVDQDDQSGLATNFRLAYTLSPRSSLSVAYNRFFTENDFGETLETDDVLGQLQLRLGRRTRANVGVNYRNEFRELTQFTDPDDPAIGNEENVTLGFLGNLEYRLGERIRTFGGYEVRNKEFFSEIFFDPTRGQREDTTQMFNLGFGYFLTEYFSIGAEYDYTDNDSNFDEQDYTRNRFSLFGRASF